MDALLANAGTSATPQPAAQEETKAAAGKGIGKGGSLKGNLEQLLKLLATLVVVHDREIQDPKDMRSIALIVPDQAVKQQVIDTREKWCDAKPEDSSPHPLACSAPL